MKTGSKPLFNEINITPLTDIFLVLLIIMMVVAPMLEYPGIKLAVPSVGPAEDVKEMPKAITVVLGPQDDYTIEKPISINQLSNTLRDMSKEKPDGVIIQASSLSSHNALTMALDSAQAAGIDKVAVMQTQDEDPQGPEEL